MITLEMIEIIEEKYGNLYQLADDLLNKALPHSIIEDILSFIGFSDDDCSLEENLTTVLLNTLEPLDTLGVICLGEELPVLEEQLI